MKKKTKQDVSEFDYEVAMNDLYDQQDRFNYQLNKKVADILLAIAIIVVLILLLVCFGTIYLLASI